MLVATGSCVLVVACLFALCLFTPYSSAASFNCWPLYGNGTNATDLGQVMVTETPIGWLPFSFFFLSSNSNSGIVG